MLAQPSRPQTIYFVDDNFIGNARPRANCCRIWSNGRRARGYPLVFACEATLNIAKQTELLELMREACFVNVFVGIETPDVDALRYMHKEQNAKLPILDSIRTLNGYGLEVTSGIILGLDTDTESTADRLIDFIEQSQIPVLTINLLQALPKTPLWDRLARDNRITDDPELESNVRFLRPYDDVVASWRRCIAHAYAPERLFERFRHQVDSTYVNRLGPSGRGKLTFANLRMGAVLASRLAHPRRPPVGLSPPLLARGGPCAAPRADRRRDGHGLRRLSPHPVHPRSPARGAERVVLFDA